MFILKQTSKLRREIVIKLNKVIIMTEDGQKLLDFIQNKIGIKETNGMPNYYHSLPVCILDDIYSLQSHYETIALPTVKRFANHYLNGDLYTSNYSINDFLRDLDNDGIDYVMETVLRNKQVVGGRRKILVCYELAVALQKLGIQTMEDFASYPDKSYLEYSIRYVKGVGNAAVDYLFMMAGDNSRVKPDIHIHHCIKDAIGRDVSDIECQMLFREVSDELRKDNPKLTPRFLDGLVWVHYSGFES